MTRYAPPDRRSGIGASEVPAIAGASPWATPVSVWLEKTGLGDGPNETGPMRAGRELEWPLMRLGARELGEALTHNAQRFRHPEWPNVPLYATPDAFGRGRRAIGEVKLVGHRAGDWRDGPPEYVRLQVAAQMAVFPRVETAYVVALLGSELRTYRVERDDQLSASIAELAGEWFRRYVVGGIAPPAQTPDDAWALLRARAAPTGRPERLAATDEMALGHVLLEQLRQRDELDKAIETGRLVIADAATNCDVVGLGWVGRWSQRQSVDWRAIARSLPIPDDVIAAHTRLTPAFTFRRLAGEDE